MSALASAPHPASLHARSLFTLVVLLALLLPPVVAPSPVHAASFTVNTTQDTADVSPGDGVCADLTGKCSLRAAVQEAEAWDGPDTITLPAGTYILTLHGADEAAAATGDLDIRHDLTIVGAGSAATIIDGDAASGYGDRIFETFCHWDDCSAYPDVSLSGLTIRNGSSGGGGGMYTEFGAITLNDVTFSNNTVTYQGGGLNSYCSDLTITGSTFEYNTASDAWGNGVGGGMEAGAGECLPPSIVIRDSRFLSNHANHGGGIAIDRATAFELTGSTVQGNTSDNEAGGITLYGVQVGTLTGTVIDSNTAATDCGGLCYSGDYLAITDSLIQNNTATSGSGGGVHASAGVLSIENSRIYWNHAHDRGGGLFIGTSELTLVDTAVQSNESAIRGGAIDFEGATNPTIRRCAILDNTSEDTGGIAFDTTTGQALIENTTLAGNTGNLSGRGAIAAWGGGGVTINFSTLVHNGGGPGAIAQYDPASVMINNSIISQNWPLDCAGTISGNYNLEYGDGSCPGVTVSADPKLDLGGDYQGPTVTYPLQPDSPAIDAADPLFTPPPNTDQRGDGYPRVVGGRADIGAYEFITTYTVNDTGDEGDATPGDNSCYTAGSKCTLRAAIEEVNAAPGPYYIIFDIPGVGVHTIRPASPLPPITEPVTIDGYTQPGSAPNTLAIGNNAALLIELDGSAAGPGANGLVFTAPSKVFGLVINSFSGAGIVVEHAAVPIFGNFIGADPTGLLDKGNGGDGVRVLGEPFHLTVGGDYKERNVIAFNEGAGVAVESGMVDIGQNHIFGNAGLGIDLNSDGLTLNHQGATAGPNSYQNFPVLTVASSDGATTTRIGGWLYSTADNYRLEFFSSSGCDGAAFGEGDQYIGATTVSTAGGYLGVFDVALPIGLAESRGVSATATNLTTAETSEFSWCRPVTALNTNWMNAQPIPLSGGEVKTGSVAQRIQELYQEKWFRFPATAGAKVALTLTAPAGSAMSLHRNPQPYYDLLTNPKTSDIAALSAESQDIAFLPGGLTPPGALPTGALPDGTLPGGTVPPGSLPYGFEPTATLPGGTVPPGSLPGGTVPPGSLPGGTVPPGSLPGGTVPPGSLPGGTVPPGTLPGGTVPPGTLPGGTVPPGSLPGGTVPPGNLPGGTVPPGSLPGGTVPPGALSSAYTGSERRSLMAASLDPRATVQTIERNTYDLFGDLYVRVVGPYYPSQPFILAVSVEGGACANVTTPPDDLAVIADEEDGPPVADEYETLILTDFSRLQGTDAEKNQARDDLQTLAWRWDVNGAVIDLASGNYPRVAWANAQADVSDNQVCPTAKNLVAEEIKAVIDRYRTDNSGLKYIVLAGGANVVPFYQAPDMTGMANEREYVVPVAPSTPSEAALKGATLRTQDYYGAAASVSRGNYRFPVPDLPVGRLVENAADVSAAVQRYVAANGVVTLDSALVTGYDFVGDLARDIVDQVTAGINPADCADTRTCYTPDTLIEDQGLPPSDPTAWSADQLAAKLLPGGHDLVFLTGHFNAGGLVAADYETEFAASSLASTDLTNVIALALGCHGGYSVPDSDVLQDVTPDPDWAKALLRRGAAGYISSSGYAYGSTQIEEWGERVFLDLVKQLRTGYDDVPLGQALVRAKQTYLAQWPQLDSYDEKTLMEMTLYGLPMLRVNWPGQKLDAPDDASLVDPDSIWTADYGPGQQYGLASANVSIGPQLSEHTITLPNLHDGGLATLTYLEGKDGALAAPFQPVYPREVYNLDAEGYVLRGVGFAGGVYEDQPGVIPLVEAPTTETSRQNTAYYTPVMYPAQTWTANFFDTITGGAARLVTTPAQFRSDDLGAATGVLRKYTGMDFVSYYLHEENLADPDVRAAAVAPPPTILGVSATAQDGLITFRVNVAADAAVGVQDVWVLGTGLSGPLHGEWRDWLLHRPEPVEPNPSGEYTPEELQAAQDALDPTLWLATLWPDDLPQGQDPLDVRFMVQAVNGAGAVSLATNLGLYYPVTPADVEPAPSAKPTALTFVNAPASGVYLHETSFTVQLTAQGDAGPAPLADQYVFVQIGDTSNVAKTGADGRATTTFQPLSPAGETVVEASFRATDAYAGSNVAQPYTVTPETTRIELTPSAVNIQPGGAVDVKATLYDGAGGSSAASR